MKEIKCNNCGKTGLFRMHRIKQWFWARCARCGFHTSSYLLRRDVTKAAELGEHYISENGNKCFNSIHDNKELA